MEKKSNAERTPLGKIREKVKTYHTKMNAIALALEGANAAVRINREKEFMEFYIEKKDLARLNEIASYPGCERLAVFFGLSNTHDKDSVTGCFLGINHENNIIPQHRSTQAGRVGLPGAIDGEDTWLPPGKKSTPAYDASKDFTLATEWSVIENHLKD